MNEGINFPDEILIFQQMNPVLNFSLINTVLFFLMDDLSQTEAQANQCTSTATYSLSFPSLSTAFSARSVR